MGSEFDDLFSKETLDGLVEDAKKLSEWTRDGVGNLTDRMNTLEDRLYKLEKGDEPPVLKLKRTKGINVRRHGATIILDVSDGETTATLSMTKSEATMVWEHLDKAIEEASGWEMQETGEEQ